MIKSVFKRSGIHFGGSIISKIFTSTVYIVLSRFISPSEYGQATLVVTFSMLGSVIGDYGLSQWYQKQEDEEKAFRSFTKVRMILAVITSILLFLTISMLKWLPMPLALVTSSVLLPHALLSIATAYLIRHKIVLKPSLQQVIQSIPILIIMLIKQHSVTVLDAVSAYLVGDIIAVFILFPRNKLQDINRAHMPLLKTLRSSSKYALLNYTSATYARADSILVRGYLGEAALGFYGLAYRYLEYFALLPSSLVQVTFPLFAQNHTAAKKHIYTFAGITGFFGMIFSLALAFCAPTIIQVFHGSAYAPAIVVMQILSATLFFMFINAPLASYVQSSDLVKAFLPFGILNTALNVSLNILLIPLYGLQGAASAMMITESTGLIINLWFVHLLRKKNG